MKTRWRRGVAAGGFALELAICAAVVGVARGENLIDRVIASVDGEPITIHDVRAFSASTGTPIPDDSDPRASDLIRKALKQVIEAKLLESESKSFESQVDEGQVDKFIERMREQNNLTDEQFRRQLLGQGTSYEDFRKRARFELEKMMMLDRDVRSKVTLSDAEVKAYYEAHLGEYSNTTERYRLAQILIAVAPSASPAEIAAAKSKAVKVQARAAKGEDFGGLAGQFSDDDSKKKGGELGYFAPDEIIDEIKTAIAGLKAGEISSLVHTSHGFHVLKLEGHDVAGPKPLDEVKEEIREKLTDAKAKEHFQHWIDEDLVKGHHVESFY